jgi:natural product precursor
MKKKNLKTLRLNKKSISSLDSRNLHFIVGGETQVGDGGACTFGSNECEPTSNLCPPTTGPRTQGKQCTVNTLGLSYCQGVQGVPPTCISVNPCA